MKKNYLLVGLFALGMMALQGCDETNSGINFGGDITGEPELGGTMEKLEPSAQKTRLQEVGLEFVNEIKAVDHENLVDVIAYLSQNLDYGIDTAYVGKLERLYEETYEGDDEGYYGSPVAAVRNLMAISYNAAQNGAKLAQNTTDIWTQTLKAGLPDVYGKFTPNTKTKEWEWDSNVKDRLEVAFTDDHNQKWVATLKGSKETTRAKVIIRDKWDNEFEYVDGPNGGTTSIDKNDDYYEFVVDVPKEVTFVVKCNNTNVVDLSLNSNVAFDGNFNVESEYYYKKYWHEYIYGYWDGHWEERVEGYWDGYYNEYGEWVDEWVEYTTEVWVEEWIEYTEGWYNWFDSDRESNSVCTFKVDYTNLNADAKLKVNAYEETFKTEVTKQGLSVSANVKVNGKQMLKVEGALKADIDAAVEEGENAYTEEKDVDEIKVDALKEFSMFIDVLGKVQVVGKCDKFNDLSDAFVNLQEAAEDDDFVKFQRNLGHVNKTYNITLHYDNTETVQANFELEAYEANDEWEPSYSYFGVRPVIVFTADDSRYSFEDYFTERSFGDLVEAVEDLYDDFEEMFDTYFEEELDLEPGTSVDQDHFYGDY